MSDPFGQILLIAILTLLNGFFAAAEMAMVSVNRNTIETLAEKKDKRAESLKKILKEPTNFLSTIQVGITFAGFFMSATTATTVSTEIGLMLKEMGIPFGQTISGVIITILLTYISIVFGELVPKRIALQNADKMALNFVSTIRVVQKVFSPFVKIISVSTKMVLKITGNLSEDIEERVSEEEIKTMIKVGQEQGLFNEEGEDMLISIFDLDDKSAYEIMTPRTEVYDIDYDEISNLSIPEILRTGYSRIPVYKDTNDNIIGTLYIKDIFANYAKYDFKSINPDEILKEPYFIPESKKIDKLLGELQASKNHIAIVIDEYGGFSGIVTVEDILEEIVGEIDDEYDYSLLPIKKVGDSHYIVDGSCDLDELNEELNINIESENYETISGFFIEIIGFIPDEEDEGCEVIWKNIRLQAIDIRDKRIQRLDLQILPEEERDEDDDDEDREDEVRIILNDEDESDDIDEDEDEEEDDDDNNEKTKGQ